MKYFLKEDYDALCNEIVVLCDRIKEIGKEMGASCQEGAETFHDNFAHEDGIRQQHMWSTKLRDLITIRNESKIIPIPSTRVEKVSLGNTVTYKEVGSNKENCRKISSFIVFVDQENCISYNSPVARILTGGMAGDIREGVVGGKKKKFEIIKIA
ncbi:MAG: GreA/GreB family elongation factor [Candidatus Moranbacteria bacterium]|nr:GreA/GreB family elongation factor [Candidatus Moranbacteria bacterium]